MKHTLETQAPNNGDIKNEISVLETESFAIIEITETYFIGKKEESVMSVCLNKKELHSFIGTLLHVQSKIK